ncbi:MAG: hypothetical protein ABUL62_34420 [Myxococcales bacterium]
MTKRTTEKSKTATAGAHPEMQHSRSKAGTPGTESSKARQGGKDVRNNHDKDGNGEQSAR